MRKLTYFVVVIGFYIINVAGFCSKSGDEDFLILEEELLGGGSGGGSTNCTGVDIVGEWSATSPCGANEDQKINFYCPDANGIKKGSINSPDCNNVCNPGLWWDFTYTVSGGVCYLDYVDNNPYTSCGTAVPAATDASFSYTVSGNTLTTSFGPYYK